MTVYRILFVLFLLGTLNGCYYLQAANGQWSLMRQREDIDLVIQKAEESPKVLSALAEAKRAKAFAHQQLLLPDNGSYQSYADLERDYVVWNVFAAKEFSLDPKLWCFPVVGCVAYRGHFKQRRADREAEKLRSQGYDATVYGVPAYSTLGRFKDPILNTMLVHGEITLVQTLFHELAHQKLYVKDDSAFNESYATAVAEIGLRLYLGDKAQAAIEATERSRQQSRQFLALVADARIDLKAIYESGASEEHMRSRKQARFEKLVMDYRALAAELGLTRMPKAPRDNAQIIPLSTYHDLVPGFRNIYRYCEQDLACFYELCDELAALKTEQARREKLQSYEGLRPAVRR